MSQNADTAPKLDWAALLFRPLLISGMTTCIAASWVMLIEAVLGDWRGGYIVGLVALVTLETLIAERQMRVRGQFYSDRLRVRLTELGVMLVVLKLASYLHRGWEALANDMRMLPYQPLSFFDGHFILGVVVVVALWLLALDIAALLAELESPGAGSQDRETARNELKNSFGIGAVILLLPIGLQGLGRTWPVLSIHIAPVNGLTLLPLLYFGLGLALFGQARLALLQTRRAGTGSPLGHVGDDPDRRRDCVGAAHAGRQHSGGAVCLYVAAVAGSHDRRGGCLSFQLLDHAVAFSVHVSLPVAATRRTTPATTVDPAAAVSAWRGKNALAHPGRGILDRGCHRYLFYLAGLLA
jgi:hypothetical protein